jgi:hypothetical protein
MMTKTKSSGLTAVVLCGALTLSSITPAVAQMPNFGAALGGAMGAAIGSRNGGSAAMAGAIMGIAAGVILQGLIDDIERRNAKSLANSSVRAGTSSTRSFKNSQGQNVKVSTRVKTTKNAEGRNCREVTTAVERDGKADAGGGTQTVCEVQLASGKVGYPTIE